jgi:hypothetical protein
LSSKINSTISVSSWSPWKGKNKTIKKKKGTKHNPSFYSELGLSQSKLARSTGKAKKKKKRGTKHKPLFYPELGFFQAKLEGPSKSQK